MGLSQLNTCKHLDVDPESGEWVCCAADEPSGREDTIVESENTLSGVKVIRRCKAFGLLGARWTKEQIIKKCDGARVVEAKIF